VDVVDGGTSTVQSLLELSTVATTTWGARRPPMFAYRAFDLRGVGPRVEERVRQGLPPTSLVGATGLALTDDYRDAVASGGLVAYEMFTEITDGWVCLGGHAKGGRLRYHNRRTQVPHQTQRPVLHPGLPHPHSGQAASATQSGQHLGPCAG